MTIDWKKDIKQSMMDAVVVTSIIYGLSWAASKAGVSKPTFTLTAENVVKIWAYTTVGDDTLAYAKEEKWIPG